MTEASLAKVRCAKCGVKSVWKEGFRLFNSFFDPRLACPECYAESKTKVEWVVLLVGAICGAAGIVVAIFAPEDALPLHEIAAILLVLPLLTVMTLIHELGHMVAACLVGDRVFSITLGWFGKPIVKFRRYGIAFLITSVPAGGMVLSASPNPNWFRLRRFLVISAGPSINFLGLMASLACAKQAQPGSFVDILSQGSAWANGILLFGALLPYRSSFGLGTVQSDGLLLLTVPFYSQKQIAEFIAAYFLLEAANVMEQNDPVAAHRWCERGLKIAPEQMHLKNYLGVVLLYLNRFAEAKLVFHELLNSPKLEPTIRALLWSNLAYADVCLEDETLLGEANQYSAQAMDWLPWVPAIMGTRGAVLLMLNRLDEAIDLLERACDKHTEEKCKAIDACFLTMALARLNELQTAGEMYDYANSLDSDCHWLDKAKGELTLAQSRPTPVTNA